MKPATFFSPKVILPDRLTPSRPSRTRRRGLRGDLLLWKGFGLYVYSEQKPNTLRDFGFVQFWRDDEDGYLRIRSIWLSGGGAVEEKGYYDEHPAIMGHLVPWDGWYSDGGSPPYNELSGWYSPQNNCMFGWVQPTDEGGEHFFWSGPANLM